MMAEAQRQGAMSPLIAFLLGAMLVAAAVVAWFVFAKASREPVEVPGVQIEAPKLPDINMPDAPKLPRG
jgi:hypothetical protein